MNRDFVHLHLHTQYSLSDAMIKPKELSKRLKELGMKKVAITDHGVMFGVVNFYKELKADGIEVIPGMETYVAPRFNTVKEAHIDNANYHLVLLCENNEGYQNLLEIASDAAINGFYYRPRTDKRKLREHSKGLIALSACLGGSVQQMLLNNDYEGAKREALEYDEIFGRGNFFLELQDHRMPEQVMVNTQLIRLSEETGIPLVVTNDCHYITRDNYKEHDILMVIQAKTTVDDEKRKRYPTDEFYVKSAEEMWNLFEYVPEALENTVKIAERCHVSFEFGVNKLPPFEIPKDFNGDNFDFLRMLSYQGLEKLYGTPLPQEIIERAEYELSVVNKMGYVNYFLIVWDFFRFCKEGSKNYGDPSPAGWKPILVGPGRGSGAGSILLYALGVTKIDPIKYNLIFERFLDPSRVSMPDVDSDFQDTRRQEVIDYVIEKYGRNSVCQIITFGTMAARSVIRQVGKAINYEYSLYDQIAKMIPAEPDITIFKALELNPELKRKYDTDEKIRYLLDVSMALEGLPLNTSTHAAGVLITDKQGLTKYVPLWNNDGAIVAQYDKNILEELGLLKMDFLGLKTLGVIGECIEFIEKNHNKHIDLDQLYKVEDLAPLKLIKDGKTVGIFQLEGAGMTKFMEELKPDSIEDIIAGISLYRPGPMKEIPRFLYNKRNPNKIIYPFPKLEPILKETYGVLCYQEQCMRTVVEIAGYDKSDSDGFRKVISKKKKKLIPLHKQWFIYGRKEEDVDEEGRIVKYPHAIPGGLALGHSKEELEQFFDLMEDFASYCFNKSHAAAYAYVAYVTAWLAYYYPVEFMAALMNSVQGNQSRIANYINYCRRELGIEIIEPDINLSVDKFIPLPNGKIAYSLNVKHASENVLKAIKPIRDERKFESFSDFLIRTADVINKQTLEALVSIGAFNSLGVVKSQILAALDDITDRLAKVKQARTRAIKSGKIDSFDFEERLKIDDLIPKLKELPEEVMLRLEKKYLGLYLTGNPLYKYAYSIKTYSNFKTSDIDYEVDEGTGAIMIASNVRDRQRVKFIGIINEIVPRVTKKKTLMANVVVEDLNGIARMIIWPQTYEDIKDKLKPDNIYKIEGYLKIESEEPPTIICENVLPVEDEIVDRLIIKLANPEQSVDVMKYIENNDLVQGNTPIYIEHDNIRVLLNKNYWVNLNKFDMNLFNSKILSW
ncbi:MAG: DNA polymerase III subunit alpha [Clostridia bacterium]|nr:DNA polymerase III subunit alpha [Clostridia bacterium]